MKALLLVFLSVSFVFAADLQVYGRFWFELSVGDCWVQIELTNSTNTELLGAYSNFIQQTLIPQIGESGFGQIIGLFNIDSVMYFGLPFPSRDVPNFVWTIGYLTASQRNKLLSIEVVQEQWKEMLMKHHITADELWNQLGISQHFARCSSTSFTGLPRFDPEKEVRPSDSIRSELSRKELVELAEKKMPSRSTNPNQYSESKREAFQALLDHPGFDDEPFFFVHAFSEANREDLLDYRLNCAQAVIPYGIYPIINVNVEVSSISEGQLAWKEFNIVRWPSRRIFLSIVTSGNYLGGYKHRHEMANEILTFSRVCSLIYPTAEANLTTLPGMNNGIKPNGILPCICNHCYGSFSEYLTTTYRFCVHDGEFHENLLGCFVKSILHHPTWDPFYCLLSSCIPIWMYISLVCCSVLCGLVIIRLCTKPPRQAVKPHAD